MAALVKEKALESYLTVPILLSKLSPTLLPRTYPYKKVAVPLIILIQHPPFNRFPLAFRAALCKRYDVTKMEDSTDAWISVPE